MRNNSQEYGSLTINIQPIKSSFYRKWAFLTITDRKVYIVQMYSGLRKPWYSVCSNNAMKPEDCIMILDQAVKMAKYWLCSVDLDGC